MVPLPHPRRASLTAAEQHRADRSERRAARKKAEVNYRMHLSQLSFYYKLPQDELKAEERKKARKEKQSNGGSGKRLSSLRKKATAKSGVIDDIEEDADDNEEIEVAPDGTKKAKVIHKIK